MKTMTASLTLGLLLLSSPTFADDDTLARFEGGIGSTPVRAGAIVNNAPLANDVFGIAPGGRPWVIRKLEAEVFANGEIEIKGKGLVLGGGNSVGSAGAVNSVFASLFCNGVAQPLNTAVVQLSASGDFQIKEILSSLPPNPCNAPVLLIRNGAGGVGATNSWFAAGIPASRKDD